MKDSATLLGMPYEMQQKIAMELDVESTLNLCLGAKALEAAICKNDTFWRAKYRRDFGPERIKRSQNWFENYRFVAISKATKIATMRIYTDSIRYNMRNYLKGEINLFHRDSLTGEVYKTSSLILGDSIVYKAELLLEEIEDPEEYVDDFDLSDGDFNLSSENENLLRLDSGGITMYVDKTLFASLLKEFIEMIKNRELGTVVITADSNITKTVTGNSRR